MLQAVACNGFQGHLESPLVLYLVDVGHVEAVQQIEGLQAYHVREALLRIIRLNTGVVRQVREEERLVRGTRQLDRLVEDLGGLRLRNQCDLVASRASMSVYFSEVVLLGLHQHVDTIRIFFDLRAQLAMQVEFEAVVDPWSLAGLEYAHAKHERSATQPGQQRLTLRQCPIVTQNDERDAVRSQEHLLNGHRAGLLGHREYGRPR